MRSLLRCESWKVSAIALLLVAVSLATLSGCSRPQDTSENSRPRGGVQLKGAGSTFSSILFKNWFKTFHDNHPNVDVSYDVVGSGEGVRRFIGQNVPDKDKVDFGASDSAMSDAQLAMVPDGAVMVPVTAGGIVLAYNLPDFKGELKLSREAYAGIFLGHITNWNDPRIAKSNPG
ncbi:MAG TPA: substrate-binding domain-containing protein, partial [Candidatus Angelobacter sp.]|nr:substrate-binding domain-containing protein [Candidatus Angelobacter sp.]